MPFKPDGGDYNVANGLLPAESGSSWFLVLPLTGEKNCSTSIAATGPGIMSEAWPCLD